MAGGFVMPQRPGDHQVVQFVFVGAWSQADADKWNEAIFQLKQLFPGNLIGVTIEGMPTPRKYRPKKTAKR
jgi:hypothetical protein